MGGRCSSRWTAGCRVRNSEINPGPHPLNINFQAYLAPQQAQLAHSHWLTQPWPVAVTIHQPWFHSYLSHREQCTVVGGASSAYIGCPVGVPQGSRLGPILFSVYINDWPEYCLHVDFQLYADDTVTFTKAKNPEEVARVLSAALTHIQTWLNRSCLILNANVGLYFSKKPSTTTYTTAFSIWGVLEHRRFGIC